MIEEFQDVVFTVDLPEHRLLAGDVGTVVDIIRGGAAFQVEVFTLDGRTLGIVTVTPEQIRPVTASDVTHARPLSMSKLTRQN